MAVPNLGTARKHGDQMQTTSDIYTSLYKNPDHTEEVKVSVAGVEYDEGRIFSLHTYGGLFANGVPAVGCCVSREIDLSIRPYGTIPRMAEIKVFKRLVLRDFRTDQILEASEWIPKGVFFIDTRQSLNGGQALSIRGYDILLQAESQFLDESEAGEWPRPAPEVVAQIAQRLGVSVDPRTVLNVDYMVSYPMDYTMREILGHIAAAHAGNWVTTDAGALLLVRLAAIPPETSYLVDEQGEAISFGGVRLIV